MQAIMLTALPHIAFFKRKHYLFRTQLHKFLAEDTYLQWPKIVWHELVMLYLSACSCLMFIYFVVMVSLGDSSPFGLVYFVYWEFLASLVFVVDYLIYFALSDSKTTYAFQVDEALADFIAVIPGLLGPLFGYYFYSWQYVRTIRLSRSLISLEQFGWILPSFEFATLRIRITKTKWHLALLLFRVLCYLFAAASVFFVLENSYFNNGKIETFIDAMYFIMVTLVTVGYGDITPVTITG